MAPVQVTVDNPVVPVDSYSLPDIPGDAFPSTELDEDIAKLLASMTIKEKIGQMTQIESGQFLNQETGEFDEAKAAYWVQEFGVGSILDSPSNHGGKTVCDPPHEFADFVDAVQKVAIEKGSKKIPLIYGLDSMHGANYVNGAALFPQNVAAAATFNPEVAYNTGRIAAKDTRAVGIQWIFGPCIDLNTCKAFPRTYEGFGEDPYLSGTMAAAAVRGMQGNYKKDRTRVAACMKHFIGYGHPINGMDKGSAWIPDTHLVEYFVPPFQACVDAGVATAMEAYNDVNGEPVVTSEFYLKTLLRDRMGFKGMLVTDWAELDHTIEFHHTSADRLDATIQGMKNTSIDMSMVPQHGDFSKHLLELVETGVIPESRVTESAGKILQLKKDLGIFEQPYADRSLIPTVGSKQDIELVLNAIRESVTLLKNANGVLPLNLNEKFLIVGPTSDCIGYLSGGWTLKWQGAHDRDHFFHGRGCTIVDGLKKVAGDSAVESIRGVDINGKWDDGSLELITKILDDGVKTVVVCLGEDSYAENFGNITDMSLPVGQLELVRCLKRLSPESRIVLVLVQGRSRLLHDVAELSDAIVNAYLPGPWGGIPIAEILCGKVNPSGRQPFSYPRTHSDMFLTYFTKNPQVEYSPLFPFAAGISYTTVSYSNLNVSATTLPIDSSITVSIIVKNTGSMDVLEVVCLYVTPLVRPGKVPERLRLRKYTKVGLKVGEEKKVEFEVFAKSLEYVGRDLSMVSPRGLRYRIAINADRPEMLETEIVIGN